MTKNNSKLSIGIGLALFFVGIFILALINSYSYSDNDLGWHLRVGNDIAITNEVPTVNYYNYTLAKDKWVDHEWLLNLGMYKVFEVSSYTGLHIFFALLIVLIVYYSWQRVRILSENTLAISIATLVLTVFALWASRPHLGIRVQEFALLLLVYVLYVIDLFPARKKLFWALPLVFIFWANIHGSFILGLGILFAFSGYLWLQPVLQKIRFLKPLLLKEYSKREKVSASIIFLLSVLGTFINPYGLKLYAFLGGYANTFYMVHIQEWQGQTSIPLYYPQLIYLAAAVSLVGLHLYSNRGRNSTQTLWNWGVSALFFILALRSRRHFPLFAFISLPILVIAVQQMFYGYKREVDVSKNRKIIAALLIAITIGLAWLAFQIPFGQDSIKERCGIKYPCAAVDYLKANRQFDDLRLLNEFNWGGYLLYAYPERQIFIDGRMPQANYKEHTILEEYSKFKVAGTDYQELLNEHGIGLIFLYSQDRQVKISKLERALLQVKPEEMKINSYLRDFVGSSSDWKEVYKDELSVIYVRSN